MSQAAISASEIGFPRRGPWEEVWGDCAVTAHAPSASARARTSERLGVNMFHLPVCVDGPARDAVVVLVDERQRVRHWLLRLATLGHELGAQRLYVAPVVPRAGEQHRRTAVPAPRHAEAGVRLREHRLLQRCLAPALAAVGRYHHLRYAAVAGIGNAGNLVVA